MPRASSNQIASRGASVALVTTLCLLFPGGMPSADPHGAFTGLLQSVNNARAGSGDDKGGTTARDFYISDVEPVVQDRCVVCHQQGLTADQQGARILFTNDADANHDAMEAFVTTDGVGADWLLGKIVGDLGHGGGPVLTEGGSDYLAFADYLTLLVGANTDDGSASASAFWDGTSHESRETTLRRAAILFAGVTPTRSAVNRASASDEALKAELINLMKGEDFHDFLINGANDRLLTDGLYNGIDFQFDFRWRFPAFYEFEATLPEERPEELDAEPYWDMPFLTQNDASNEFYTAVVREPLELIAYIVETNRSYKKILTADYTMVNAFSAIGYQSDAQFDGPLTDELGLYDRSLLNDYRPGRNVGHIPFDDDTYFDDETGETTFSGYHEWPHAGILSMPAWLGRYPSTDTNRNRARARWTYYHFLDIDIENSAPRTTDPVALADTNNPTMNNPACTVCHERMDPVAGTYQSFGDAGHYLDQHGGMDSLPDSYKHPEWYGGEAGSTGYQEGDTWYRDMRAPGFEGETHTGGKDSLQWLGARIAEHPRFKRATVKFWWPAVFGTEALSAPTDRNLPGYEAQLQAYNAQEALIDELAAGFEAGGFKVKSLLADMVLSSWYRTASAEAGLDETREAALAHVGRGRLLTPEELDRKNRAVFGRTWGEHWRNNAHHHERLSNFNRQWGGYATFYGGIDGAAVTQRNRQLTPLMSNVTEKMAVDLACQVVLEDFYRPPEQRLVFTHMDKNTDPMALVTAGYELMRDASLPQDAAQYYQRELDFSTGGGGVSLRFLDSSPLGCIQDEENSTDDRWEGWCSHMGVESVEIRKSGRLVASMLASEFEDSDAFDPMTWTDSETGEVHPRGWLHTEGDGTQIYYAHTNAGFSLGFDLAAGDYQATVNLVSMMNEGHPEDSVVADVSVRAQVYDPTTEGAVALRKQIDDIYLRATGEALDPEVRAGLVDTFLAYSNGVAAESDWFNNDGSNCEIWHVWNLDIPEGVDWWAREGDPKGTMRGWTLILQGLMTSYPYLHD